MSVPVEILQKQLCSQCHKYLSVSPIKVYPNRQVKCGRCSNDDDFGVESPYYYAVIKNMMFPCVNRYNGCNVVLPMSKMRNHENDCDGGVYDCFLCDGFRGIAYNLNLHCQKYHQKETLQNSEFLIDFNKSYNEIFFYTKGIRMFFVHFNYDIDSGRLMLDVTFIGHLFRGVMSYSVRIYSIQKELVYKINPLLCSVMERKLGTRAVCNVNAMEFERKIGICQFSIHKEPVYSLTENIPVIDSSFDSCILKCVFKNVQEHNFEESLFFPAVYYFKDIAWKVFIKRKLSLTDYKRKLGVFLQWENHSDDQETCKVSATFSILSSEFRTKLSKHFIKRQYRANLQSHGVMLADWNYIMDPASGFADNSINIEVKVRIYQDYKKEIKCNDCRKSCVYCNDD